MQMKLFGSHQNNTCNECGVCVFSLLLFLLPVQPQHWRVMCNRLCQYRLMPPYILLYAEIQTEFNHKTVHFILEFRLHKTWEPIWKGEHLSIYTIDAKCANNRMKNKPENSVFFSFLYRPTSIAKRATLCAFLYLSG